ncbi:hypothetical protein H2199_003776 [Coniosporium tulheliwenetii]|uniref:Uncharacterized protein n=1 Tax=Coniosporium tulheliwenetii TaxID=3383036 RepID=A0ACC2Z8V4_9PEZI|nr:hypothetical protein H2199_003776 [Cladosporium sp. JES 115]
MPFHAHHQPAYPSGSTTTPGAAAGIYQAAQALGSIGAPTGNLRAATSATTNAGTDALLPASGNAPGLHSGTAPPSTSGLPGPGANSSQQQQFETPRRSGTVRRQGEELHITSGSSTGQHPAAQQQHHHQQVYSSQDAYSTGSAPNISLQQATPQGSHFSSTPAAGNVGSVPGSLQPNLQPAPSGRPGPQSAYTAPSVVPTIPHINTNAQQYTLPTRSNTMSTSHNYSRSSPAGLEQKYIPFSNTPENAKYTPTPQQQSKYYNPQIPSGPASQSPLGLADIRPRANSSMADETPGTPILGDSDRQQKNCNYLAPWAVYAFDWCKWPVHGGNSAGKIAVGSYLEDPHNFIQILDTQITPQEPNTPGSVTYGLEYVKVAEATCSYPVTRILWEPPSSQKQSTDLLATSGDHLRLWSLPQSSYSAPNISSTITRSSSVNTRDPAPQKLTPLALLSNSKSPEHTAPLTSLDWNTVSPKLIITSSIDTTCTIWDIPTLTAKTQLIAHDKEVFDVRFCAGSVDVFVSCGADGSVRMFDLRSLEHSTIIYEPAEKGDKDKAAGAAGTGTGGGGTIQAKGPAMSWRCDYEIGNLSWAPQSGLTQQGGEWVGVAAGRGVGGEVMIVA